MQEENMNRDISLKLKELYSCEYYIPEKESLYLQYLDSFPTVRDVIERVNTRRYLELYTHIEPADMSKGYLILVN